jgi:hypothetical protein
METRAIVDPENPADCSGDRTDRPANHSSHRTGVSVAHRGTFLCASDRALRLCRYRKRQCRQYRYL